MTTRLQPVRQLGGRVPWFNGGWKIRALAVDRRGQLVLAGGERGLRVFHAGAGELVRTFAPRMRSVSPEAIGFSTDGTLAYARIGGFHEKKRIGVWDVETGALLREVEGDVQGFEAVDGARAITTNNHEVALWDLGAGARVHVIQREMSAFGPAAFLGVERAVIAAGGEDVILWELGSGHHARMKVGPARSLAGAPDASWFAAGDDYSRVRIHAASDGALLATLGEPAPNPYGNAVSSIAISANGQRLAAISASRVLAWDVEKRALVLDEKLPHVFYQAALVIDPAGSWIVAGAKDTGEMRRLVVGAPNPPPAIEGHAAPITAVAFDERGEVFSFDGTRALRWDESGSHEIARHDAPAALFASREETRVLTSRPPAWLGALDGAIDGEEYAQDRRAGAAVVGETLAANVMQDGECLIWDLAISKEPIHRLDVGRAAHELGDGRPMDIAFHPDGRRVALATNNTDAPVQVWDARAGRQLLVCMGHESTARSVAFSHDGRLLAAGSEDRTVRIWRVE